MPTPVRPVRRMRSLIGAAYCAISNGSQLDSTQRSEEENSDMPTPVRPVTANAFPNRSSLLRHFQRLPVEIQPHFEHLAGLLQSEFPLEVCLAYLFFRVELAHRD